MEHNYAGKYLLTATFRADGTSKDQEKWGYFPSVGVGWVISDENFMKDTRTFDLLKLRGSWGKSYGNDNVPPSTGYAVVYSGNDYSGIFNSTGTTNGIPATGYRIDPLFGTVAEAVDEWDVGMDLTVLNKRLKGSVDYYHRRTNDLAFERTYPFISNVKVYSNG